MERDDLLFVNTCASIFKHPSKFRLLSTSVLVLLCLSLPDRLFAQSEQNPANVTDEIRLSDALEQLREAGLNVVYSSRLVTKSMRAGRIDSQGDLVETANQMLAAHGLTLQAIDGNIWVVTRLPPTIQKEPSNIYDLPQELPLVEIYASRYRIGAQASDRSFEWIRTEMHELPGLNEDILRVTQFLPGTANNGFSAKTHIRGGADNETLVLFDDIPIYAPYHFKDFGAILGIFDPAISQQTDLYTGVYPVRFGGRLSAVMDITARQPSDKPQHEIGISLLSTRALSVGKSRFRDNDFNWLVAGRRSIIKEISELVEKDDYQPEFSDALLRGEISVGDWRITLGGLFLDDRLQLEIEDEDESESDAFARYRDSLLWLHADRDTGDILWRVSAANSERHTDRVGHTNRPTSVVGNVVDIREANTQYLRVEARGRQGWVAGIETQSLRAEYDYSANAIFASTLSTFFSRPRELRRRAALRARGDMWAAYGSYTLTPSPRWRMDAGVRIAHYDHFSSVANADAALIQTPTAFDSTAISPRLALQYAWSDTLTLRAGVGRMTQAERPDELGVADGDASFHGLQYANQWVFGLEQRLGDRGVLRLETYRKEIKRPAPRNENLLDPLTLLPELQIDRSRIQADSALLYGIELNAQVELSPQWSWWGGYAWAEAKDRFGSIDVTRSWNQQHTLLTGVTWRSGPWTTSLSTRWHSGWRQSVLRNDLVTSDLQNIQLERNASDWPGYFSTDLRIMWDYGINTGNLRTYLDIINVTQRSNPCCTEIAVQSANTNSLLSTRERNWLPRYALLGVTWEF
jgi:hypothetical protein